MHAINGLNHELSVCSESGVLDRVFPASHVAPRHYSRQLEASHGLYAVNKTPSTYVTQRCQICVQCLQVDHTISDHRYVP